VRESATPTVREPSPLVRASTARSPYSWRSTDRWGACASAPAGRNHNDSAASAGARMRGMKFTTENTRQQGVEVPW
jgi:hypothetical protein